MVLAGHLDTVPANGNAAPRIDGDTLWGLGSADMKGGVAVMLELASALADPAVDVTYVFYAGEEVAREHNGLLAIDAAAPDLLEGDAAILGEPTGARIEAGCQGVLKLEVEVGGARAHTARPWMGANAMHRLGTDLDGAGGLPGAAAGDRRLRAIARPCRRWPSAGGSPATWCLTGPRVTLNHRFAPDRTSAGGGSGAASAARAAPRPGPRGPAERRRSPAGGRPCADPSHPGRPG